MSAMTASVTRPPALRMTGRVAELEPEDDRGVDPVVQAGDDEHLGRWAGRVSTGV